MSQNQRRCLPSSSSERAISPSISLRQQRVTAKLYVVVSCEQRHTVFVWRVLQAYTGWRTKLTFTQGDRARICGVKVKLTQKKFWDSFGAIYLFRRVLTTDVYALRNTTAMVQFWVKNLTLRTTLYIDFLGWVQLSEGYNLPRNTVGSLLEHLHRGKANKKPRTFSAVRAHFFGYSHPM